MTSCSICECLRRPLPQAQWHAKTRNAACAAIALCAVRRLDKGGGRGLAAHLRLTCVRRRADARTYGLAGVGLAHGARVRLLQPRRDAARVEKVHAGQPHELVANGVLLEAELALDQVAVVLRAVLLARQPAEEVRPLALLERLLQEPLIQGL
eukprot:CAMPEP_0175681902 /NCGR_PEP_ID=MMETSP0097-20121207/25537_1 /TAXON_ID=311494 /ORGANISM="Alexandrium monilatum, Strain CCMP3105" /LENGTH=152 /DNA_ID=CAMNT_0016988767 /DNA_START=92 /DNA_END=547 /DNA_ORIENTATION=+